jgi:polar amino acid transport system substrate-binding protein
VPVSSRSLPAALAAAALAIALAGCGGSTEPAESGGSTGAAEASSVDLVNDGQLTVCTHLPYEPFQFQQGDEIVGFDVDLIDLVAEQLGVPQKIVNTPFDTIQSGADLDTGKCDVAAAAITITEDRKKDLAFSDPYFEATQALLVQEGSGIDGVEDLAGKKLGVQLGTTGAKYAQENIQGAELVTFEDLGLLLSAVQTGRIDAAINDNEPLSQFVEENPGLVVTEEFGTDEQYGFAVRQGNTALLEVINKTLAEAKSNGTYDRIYEKWFGETPSEN